jgi:hypothetical protein
MIETATLSEIRVYPIKSLDGASVDATRIGRDGGLEPDRTLALVDADGQYVNGKRERAIHHVSATFDLDAGTVSLEPPHPEDAPGETVPEPETFAVAGLGSDQHTDEEDHDALAAWFEEYLGYEVHVEAEEPGYPDDTTASGPTVVSRATLRAVGEWFGFDTEEVLRRFRVNLVFDDAEASLPAFWEDRLYGDTDEHVAFTVGDTTLEGVGPCFRCVVPTRDPDTGAETPEFQRRFVENREETLPAWSEGPRFDGAFRLTVNTAVPQAERGSTLRVGDDVRIRERVARPEE